MLFFKGEEGKMRRSFLPQVDPLSRNEQLKLVEKSRLGDKDAKIKLFASLQGLIIKNILVPLGIPKGLWQDAIQNAYIGFEKALVLYDPSKRSKENGEPVKFSTYALYWMENFVRRGVKQDGFVKLINSTSMEEFASRRDGSEEEGENEIMLRHRAQEKDPTYKEATRSLFRDILFEVMKESLTPREREILVLHFGLDGDKPLTQREIAQRLGVCPARIWALKKRALEKLRLHLLRHYPSLKFLFQ